MTTDAETVCAKCGFPFRDDCDGEGFIPQIGPWGGFPPLTSCPSWARSILATDHAAQWPLPERYRGARLADFPDAEAFPALRWLGGALGDDPDDSRSLLLFGTNGTGKTHLAAALVLAARAKRKTALLATVSEFLDSIRETFDRFGGETESGLFDSLVSVDLLALDDVGKQPPTPWASERLFELVNRRYNELKPTIVTTNLSREEWESGSHMRAIFSRLNDGAERLHLKTAHRNAPRKAQDPPKS